MASKPLAGFPTEAIRIETPAPIVTVIAPRASFITDRNCEGAAGLTKRALRKIGRGMKAAGFPVRVTADGMTVVADDLEKYLREHAPAFVDRERERKEAANDAEPSDELLLKRGGVKLGARK